VVLSCLLGTTVGFGVIIVLAGGFLQGQVSLFR
jgi:hypothetical protein